MVGLTSGEMGGKMMEIGRNKVEINGKKEVDKLCKKLEKIGLEFIKNKSNRVKNIFDWRIVRDVNKKNLSFSKKAEKQHLKIHYEQQVKNKKIEFKMSGFDFTFSDGKTKIRLHKDDEGGWKIIRINKDDQTIEGGNILRKGEETELTNFLQKFKLDRNLAAILNIPKNVNKALDKVDPIRAYRYVLPVAATAFGLVTGGFQGNSNQTFQETWHKAFLGPPPISQPVGDIETRAKKFKPSKDRAEIMKPTNLESQIQAEQTLSLGNQEASGLLQELSIVLKFYDPEKPIAGPPDKVIENFLKNLKDSNGLSMYLNKDGKLDANIENALHEINKNPQSQDSYYSLLDAIHQFNTGRELVTPAKILQQANATGNNPRTAYLDTKDKITGEPEFNKGLIKANEAFEYTLPGDFIVTADNSMGLVTSIAKDESGNLLSVNISVFNETSGDIDFITITSENSPIGFSYFIK